MQACSPGEDPGAAFCVDELHECGEYPRIGLGEHAVPQVEDVPRCRSGPPEHVSRLFGHHLPGGEADRRVEVALDRMQRSEPRSGRVQRHPPVHSDDLRAGLGHEAEQLAGADAEEDAWHSQGVDGLEHPSGRWQREPCVLGRGEDACPAVEQLHDRGTRADLRGERRGRDVSQLLDEGAPDERFGVHERLDPGERARRPPFDEVARDGEGGAGEADERHVRSQLARHERGCLPDVGGVLLRDERPESAKVVFRGERPGDDRTATGLDHDAKADRVDRDHDVGEEDRCVHSVAVYRLEGELGSEGRVRDRREDVARASCRAVLGERAPCLAHEPHRGVGHGSAQAGGHERRRVATRCGPVSGPRTGAGIDADVGRAPRARNGHTAIIAARAALHHRGQCGTPATSAPVNWLVRSSAWEGFDDVTQEQDVQEEQRFLDRAYDGLESMRAEATRMLESVLDVGRGGTFQSRTERDIVVRTSLARLAQLDIGDQALCFGRIDRVPEPGRDQGETFHIGRLAVSGPDHEPLVVDWRAPVAEPFYRATGLDPQGLARRRHLAVSARTVTGVEDEYFAAAGPDTAAPASDAIALGGPGALLSALSHARTGFMGDIVATIQREQDEIIRSPLGGLLMVQGGPGTGKTAVALHRAAYLLYTYRFPLERQGVLVVGPNPLFLRYIERVLPSLGEAGVTLSTVAGLVPEIRVRSVDRPAVARLKGDARMAKVLVKAVRTRERGLRRDLEVPFGATTLRLAASETREIVSAARRRPGPHNGRRRFVEHQVLQRLAEQYDRARRGLAARSVPARGTAADRGLPSEDGAGLDDAGLDGGWRDGGGLDTAGLDTGRSDVGADLGELRRQIRRSPVVAEALDRMWPRLAPHELVHDLFGAHPLLVAAGSGILSDAEVAMLYRPRSTSLDQVPWTAADAALVDEARALLGPRRSRPRQRSTAPDRAEQLRAEHGFWPAGLSTSPLPDASPDGAATEEVRAYGHIVVDEAQDLSPMQLRMLARRSISGSMTVVGDIAQATGPWVPTGWEDVERHLSPARRARVAELSVGYRTPAEVMDVAAGVLAVAAPGLRAPTPVRRSGEAPRAWRSTPGGLAATTVQAVSVELAAVAGGRVAVLAPAAMATELVRTLEAAGLDAVDPRDPDGPGLAAPLVVLPAAESHGLEFDSVVVVEPAAIVAGEAHDAASWQATPAGYRALYVALTRPTRRLAVVHALDLPRGLELP